jgi:hypothetical protein
MSEREIFATNDGGGAVVITEHSDGEVWIVCSDADSAGCQLTRSEVIALRDALSEWIDATMPTVTVERRILSNRGMSLDALVCTECDRIVSMWDEVHHCPKHDNMACRMVADVPVPAAHSHEADKIAYALHGGRASTGRQSRSPSPPPSDPPMTDRAT